MEYNFWENKIPSTFQKFNYKAKSGKIIKIDNTNNEITYNVGTLFEHIDSKRLAYYIGKENSTNYLWFHRENESGATYWDTMKTENDIREMFIRISDGPIEYNYIDTSNDFFEYKCKDGNIRLIDTNKKFENDFKINSKIMNIKTRKIYVLIGIDAETDDIWGQKIDKNYMKKIENLYKNYQKLDDNKYIDYFLPNGKKIIIDEIKTKKMKEKGYSEVYKEQKKIKLIGVGIEKNIYGITDKEEIETFKSKEEFKKEVIKLEEKDILLIKSKLSEDYVKHVIEKSRDIELFYSENKFIKINYDLVSNTINLYKIKNEFNKKSGKGEQEEEIELNLEENEIEIFLKIIEYIHGKDIKISNIDELEMLIKLIDYFDFKELEKNLKKNDKKIELFINDEKKYKIIKEKLKIKEKDKNIY